MLSLVQLPGIHNDGLAQGLTVLHLVSQLIDGNRNIQAFNYLTKDGVVAIKMGCRCHDDGEVGTVCIRSHICHREETSAVMLQSKTTSVILKVAAEHTLSMRPCLVDEVVDNTVEGVAFEVIWLAGTFVSSRYYPFLSGAQRAEIFRGSRSFGCI